VNGPSLRVLIATTASLQLALAQQQDEPLAALRLALPEVVLADCDDSIDVADFGLGGGGVAAPPRALRFDAKDGCVTPGGVRVACRSAGVKLTFPSGRELLVAPDGALHLRSGEVAGPFGAGVELLLADGARVRIALAQGRRNRLRDVWVVHGARALQPWRRGAESRRTDRVRAWSGVRLACCGDGGDLYRPLGLGALLVLERVLVEAARREQTPTERLVVWTGPLERSLEHMPRQHRETQQHVRRAVAAVEAVAEQGAAIFRDGAALRRASRERLRWLLGVGFELELELDGPLAPRLQLFAGRSPLPMVEWTLGAAGAAYLTNPNPDQLGKRWHGNGTRMPRVAPELQVREHLEERPRALELLRRLAGGR
jgi:hypothetical protein